MAYLPILKPNELVRIIEKQGFSKDRQSGSHAIFSHKDGRWTSVPIHRKTIGKGLLRKILRDIQLTVNDIKRK
ncbi:MAG: type II toxin-antitoxin system HicA family toxin [Candidatus Beckwithbacteria bacterium]|nr:type II toxin-antitoxin system HicA family toxin [Candidatus Beckwithbacteria bacterium]